MANRWAGTGAVLGVMAAMASGCALTAPALGGAPRGGAFAQVQTAWAVSMGPASATLTGPGLGSTAGTIHVDGNAENIAGNEGMALLGTPIPINAGVRQSLGAHADLAAALGWHDSGVELRLGPGPGDGVPWAIAAGARAGRFGLLGDHRTYEGRVRFEAYPHLQSPYGPSNTELALSLGVSAGVFSHFLPLPDNRDPADTPSAPPNVQILRPEVRIEGAIGLAVPSVGGGFTVALMPWVAVASGTPIASDRTITVTSFDESVGVSLVFAPGGGHDLVKPNEQPSSFHR